MNAMSWLSTVLIPALRDHCDALRTLASATSDADVVERSLERSLTEGDRGYDQWLGDLLRFSHPKICALSATAVCIWELVHFDPNKNFGRATWFKPNYMEKRGVRVRGSAGRVS